MAHRQHLDDDDLNDAEDNYHESSDEDFNPTNAPAEESSASSDEEEPAAKPKQRKGKRKAPATDDLDSGDEVTIEAARKRKTKKRKGDQGDNDDDLILSDDGEGGLVKTRAQRRGEQKERKPLARTEGATVDVDALWAEMSAAPLKPLYSTQTEDTAKEDDVTATGVAAGPSAADQEEDQVTVKKVYSFAGQRTTEEKQIPRSSLDKYLSDGWKAADPVLEKPGDAEDKDGEEARPKIRRPLRRPSRFDPNPTGYVRNLAPEFQLSWPRKATATTAGQLENVAAGPEIPRVRQEKAQKLNVVDKSRLDWTGFVDKEGIAEELDTHGKTKEAYLGRMDFLAGVEARKEEERRRLKTAAV